MKKNYTDPENPPDATHSWCWHTDLGRWKRHNAKKMNLQGRIMALSVITLHAQATADRKHFDQMNIDPYCNQCFREWAENAYFWEQWFLNH